MKLDEIYGDVQSSKGPQDYKLFVDLDGVLVDFLSGVHKFIPDYSEQKYETDKKFRDRLWDIIKAHAKEGGKFWFDLQPMSDMKQLWNYVKSYNPEILTATGHGVKSAGEQKTDWVKKYLGNIPVHLVMQAKDKQKYAAKNHILIDDKRKAIDPWVAAGGIGILHTSAASTIEQLKKLGF